jgi:hypothetical protein
VGGFTTNSKPIVNTPDFTDQRRRPRPAKRGGARKRERRAAPKGRREWIENCLYLMGLFRVYYLGVGSLESVHDSRVGIRDSSDLVIMAIVDYHLLTRTESRGDPID